MRLGRQAKRAHGRTTPRERKTRKRAPRATPVTWVTSGDASRLLALDASSKAVGWAFFVKGHLHSHGKYIQVGLKHGERLTHYLAWLHLLFKKLSPTSIAVEAPFQGRHRFAFAVLTLYRAALMIAHVQWRGDELPETNQLPAHIIKKVLGMPKGTHEENKAHAVERINQLYGTTFKFDYRDKSKTKSDDDIADAIAVGHAWLELHASC